MWCFAFSGDFQDLVEQVATQKRRTTSAGLKKKNMTIGVKKKGSKENKLSYIRVVLSLDNVGTKD
jgi:hypothetical protein